MSDKEKNNEETSKTGNGEGNSSEEGSKKETVGLSKEEVAKLIEDARKQEKDKLYDRIDSLKKEVSELSSTAKADKEEKEQIRREARDAAEEERLSKLSDAQKLAEQMKKIEERLVEEQRKREELEQAQAQLREERDDERRLREVEEYKRELLNDAGDEIIPDLVTGNTRQEVESSIARAKARYQEIFAATTTKARGNAGRNMPSPTNPDPDPMDEEDLKGVLPNDIDPKSVARGEVSEKYLKNREELLDRVAKAYQRQMGN